MSYVNTKGFKFISVVVLSVFFWTFGGLHDIVYGATLTAAIGNAQQAAVGNTAKKLQDAIEGLDKTLSDKKSDLKARAKALKAQWKEIQDHDKEIRKVFGDTERRLKKAGLPKEILDRHREFVKKYEQNWRELEEGLSGASEAESEAAYTEEAKKLKAFLEKTHPPRKHRPLDPNKLPNRTAKPVKKKPRLKKEEFQSEPFPKKTSMLPSETPWLSSALSLLPGVTPAYAEEPPSGDDYLGETIEVQFTQAIQDKAAELDHNPVKIYHWVRNNVKFVPSYGSIQGADYCLQTMRGNAFDIASLLIALLRVSGIPARYVLGTVEIPSEKVMNWLGRFEAPMDALNFLATSGIPSVGMVVDNEIRYIQFEHVWVKAWVDYLPSRGSRQRLGEEDTWVPLDASYKQYEYTPGITLSPDLWFDVESLVQHIESTATINDLDGYVVGIDASYIQQAKADYETQLDAYFDQNHPEATVADLLGQKDIVPQGLPYLMGTLPYRSITIGGEVSELPEAYRHKLQIKVVKDPLDELTGSPIQITTSLPEVAGKKMTLAYAPATQQDEDIIRSYLPAPHTDGTPISPDELPTSIPSYLINLKPELRIDGTLIATGTTIPMGEYETMSISFISPARPPDTTITELTSGEYYGVAIDLGYIPAEQIEELKGRIEITKSLLEAQSLEGVSKDDIFGDLTYSTALLYFAELDDRQIVMAQSGGIAYSRLPSQATCTLKLHTHRLFDLTPISVSSGGISMDVPRNLNVVSPLDGDTAKKLDFTIASGMSSSELEHLVLEEVFSIPEEPLEGSSAVKILHTANSLNMPIYTVTSENVGNVLPQLQISQVALTDIENAVNAGMVVTVPQSDVSIGATTGIGYMAVNPETGSGAYIIIGGLNGGLVYASWLAGYYILMTAYYSGLVAHAFLLAAALGPALLATETFALAATVACITKIRFKGPHPHFWQLASKLPKRVNDAFQTGNPVAMVVSLSIHLGRMWYYLCVV